MVYEVKKSGEIMVEKDVLDKYKKLFEIGYTPEQIYLAAQRDGYKTLDLWYIRDC